MIPMILPPEPYDDDHEPSTWGILGYPAHIPVGLPLPNPDDRPDGDYVL